MRLFTLTYSIPLTVLRRDFVYTVYRVKRMNHMKAFVVPMATQLDGINAAIVTETVLLDAVENARAEVDDADEQLDELLEEGTAQARIAVNNVLSDPLWHSMFGNRRPSEWSRLRLGEELDQLRTWPGKLKGAPTAALRDLVPRLEACIVLCDAAEKAETDALTAHETWKLGARVALIDKVNALRKQLVGEAEAHVHTTHGPRTKGLGMFRLSSPKRGTRQGSITALQAEITAAKAELTALELQLVAAQKQAEDEAQAETQRATTEAQLAELEKNRSETDRHIAELRHKLSTNKK
jgi:hypothetical protein